MIIVRKIVGRHVIFFISLEIILFQQLNGQDETASKICIGSENGLAKPFNSMLQYTDLIHKYKDCMYIDKNLEITHLMDTSIDYDFSFLRNIREVNGYVLIYNNYVKSIPLPNLTVIRGETLLSLESGDGTTNVEKYSLIVTLNYKPNKTVGLEELQMPNLREIMKGKVFIHGNQKLCYDDTIDWSAITEEPVVRRPEEFRVPRNCPKCHKSCYIPETGKRHCWGAGRKMCQRFTKGICSNSCVKRCFGKLPNQCCSIQCAGGCFGPTNSECMSCTKFVNDGVCVESCPRLQIYNPKDLTVKDNPDGKYAYGGTCIKECPANLVAYEQGCVKVCPKNYYAAKDRICKPCVGHCPKTCVFKHRVILSTNIDQLRNCTVVQGSVVLLMSSMKGDKFRNAKPLKPEQLSVLKTVREVYGHVQIQHTNGWKNLSFLSNLEIIRGSDLDSLANSLQISNAKDLEFLDLTNLREIRHGRVQIVENPDLCYVDEAIFQHIRKNEKQTVIVQHNKLYHKCKQAKKVCHKECNAYGCMGPGPTRCYGCQHKSVNNKRLCLSKCSDYPMLFDAMNNTCYPCHEQCAKGCTGPTAKDCLKCRNVLDGNTCIRQCSLKQYKDEYATCQPCHRNCHKHGCTGNSNELKDGGCNRCVLGIVLKNRTMSRIECFPPERNKCPDNYYKQQYGSYLDSHLCLRCHEQCLVCENGGAYSCSVCRNVRHGDTCIQSCPLMMYKENKQCVQCHDMCGSKGCFGNSSYHCNNCFELAVYYDESSRFNCTDVCPSDKPVIITNKRGVKLCVAKSHPEARKLESKVQNNKWIIIGISIPAFLVILAVVIVTVVCCKKLKLSKEKIRITEILHDGPIDVEELSPGVKPNVSKLTIANESEIRKGELIGSGAFGSVFRGMYIPSGQNVKIPVAIKVLNSGIDPVQNRELVEEARVMSCVNHKYCIKNLAICLTAEVMLIMQLVPYNNILEYIRTHKDKIGSKLLITWCSQIAEGMCYLEECGIVHRDLAARNVLVQKPNHIRITDFGLAKLLDSTQDCYHASGGKMPIKWLALECIQYRRFTHKSDVWSYGVTLWELFTFGMKPYDNVPAKNMPSLLEKGERLQQPPICTIDVYMILIKCWMADPPSRPSFLELHDQFDKMSQDPARYLVIQRDSKADPSQSTSEDLMRSMSLAHDVPGDIIDADDYQNPNVDHVFDPTDKLLSHSFPMERTSPRLSPGKNEPYKREIRHIRPNVESPHKKRQQERHHSANSRYCSNPKMSAPSIAHELENASPPTPPIPLNELTDVTPVKRSMRIDEDDYLQPQSSNTPAYLEVTDGYYNELSPWKLEPGPTTKLISMQNPVYFSDMSYQDIDDSETIFTDKPEYVNSIASNHSRCRGPSESTV